MNIPCPDEERLADYLEGRLADEGTSEVEEHLSDCETCLETFVVADGLMRGRGRVQLESVPPKVTEFAVILVTGQEGAIAAGSVIARIKQSVECWGTKISDFFWPRLSGKWQHATIRSSSRIASENLVCVKVPFREIETEIEIEKTGANRALIRVRLPRVTKPTKAIRVTLKQGEREIASYRLDAANVLFEDIPFGHYGISLAEDGVRLGTYLFEIKEDRHGRRQE